MGGVGKEGVSGDLKRAAPAKEDMDSSVTAATVASGTSDKRPPDPLICQKVPNLNYHIKSFIQDMHKKPKF